MIFFKKVSLRPFPTPPPSLLPPPPPPHRYRVGQPLLNNIVFKTNNATQFYHREVAT